MGRLTDAELRRRRAHAQLLQPARRSPARIVRDLLVVQAQDLRQAYIALWARGVAARERIDAAFERGEIVITWLNRGTLHMVAAEDWAWMHSLTAPTQRKGNTRRLRQEGVTEAAQARAMRALERLLAGGPKPRAELREALGLKGQGFVHVLSAAALEGVIVRGPRQDWVLTGDWLGPQRPVDRDKALRELGRRYLKAHAPAGDVDLAWWAGLPLRDARAALEGARPRLRPAEPVPARLLPAWDEYLLGWKDRSFHVADEDAEKLYRGGLIGPVATVDGVSVGKWRARKGEHPVIEPFGRLAGDARAALEREAAALAAYLA